MKDVLAVVGALSLLAVLAVFAVAAFLLSSAASADRRRQAAEEAERIAKRERQAAADRVREAEEEAIRVWHDRMRGKIHHPKGHPVHYAMIDDLMPHVVDLEVHADGAA